MRDIFDAGCSTGGGDPEAPLDSGYDVILLDLDGTVYRGTEPVRGAAAAVAECRSTVVFVTNNASRRPSEVVVHLGSVGIGASPEQIVTSAQVGARLVASTVAPGAEVLVVGAPALKDEVRACGLSPVDRCTSGVRAVVQGFSPDVGWAVLAEAALAIGAGCPWIATNVDTTLPSDRGLLPGNGSLVAVLTTSMGVEPRVAGKPGARIFVEAARMAGADRPLVVGDRLDTDIAGAVAAGMDSVAVLTGVSTVADLVRAPAWARPTYVAEGLDALLRPAEQSAVGPQRGWTCTWDGDRMRLRFDRGVHAKERAASGDAQSAEGSVGGWGGPDVGAGVRAAAWAAWRAGFTGRFVGSDPVSERVAALCDAA